MQLATVLVIGCILGLGLIYLAAQLDDSQAARDRAQAELVRAETERARTDAVTFQQRYILFATTLVTLTHGIDLLDILLLALTAAVGFLGAWIWKGGPAKL